jgi:hypothetical protein
MAFSLQLGFPEVPKSITNPSVDKKDALDVGTPFAFLDFIKIINTSFSPDSLQNYYNAYLTDWNNYNKSKGDSEKDLIVSKYKEFLKDIVLKHTTLEEKEFLSKIDFDDPLDLEIALGFYSRKLKELCLFYNNKRNNAKFRITANKMKGTNYGSEITIKELVLSYIDNIEESQIYIDLDSVKANLEIEIEELYDIHPLYFNQEPDETVYDNKDLDYGLNIFLKDNATLINEVFSGFSEDLKRIKEVDELFDNKRKLTEKYMGTSFYYLSTGSTGTTFLSGKLFDNQNTIKNFINRNYPTTASTTRDSFENRMERGFFRPINTSFVMIDGVNKEYVINSRNLEPNSLYFFPDPKIFGNNLPIFQFVVDDSKLKRNTSSGISKNHPNSSKFDTKYYGYTSRLDPNVRKYLNSIFNSGYVADFKKDIYGNSYGLFKDGFDRYFVNVDANSPPTYNLVFNGYEFFDEFYNEGYNFNYFTEDDVTYSETIRSGLSTNTGFFTTADVDLFLSFGKFDPYYPIIPATEAHLLKTERFIDAGFILKPNLSAYADPVSSDLSAFELSTDEFYYTTLLEGGVNAISPLQRALLDPLYPSLTANFLTFPKTSAFGVIDCGSFYDNLQSFGVTQNSLYIDDMDGNSSTRLIPQSTYNALEGDIYIKNSYDKSILPLLSALPYLTDRHSVAIVNELSGGIRKFEVIYDNMIIETDNYLVIEKINFADGQFKEPIVGSKSYTHNIDNFNKISNRFKVDNSVYYCTVSATGSFIDGDFRVFPKIYKFDPINFKNYLLFPTATTNLEYFTLTGELVEYIAADTPKLTYSKVNNVFNISLVLKDHNYFPKIVSYDWILNPDVEFIDKRGLDLSNIKTTNTFLSSFASTLTIFLSSNGTQIVNEEIVI